MNILVISHHPICENSKGGTEISTIRVISYLQSVTSWGFYNIYVYNTGKEIRPSSIFSDIAQLRRHDVLKQLGDYIAENKIDIVINEGCLFIQSDVNTLKSSFRNLKTIFVHHLAYGDEMYDSKVKWIWYDIMGNYRRTKNMVRLALFPLHYSWKKLALRYHYRKAVENSDKFVVLCENNRLHIKKNLPGTSGSGLTVIGNIIPSPDYDGLTQKKKRALLMSRMSECQKRVSLAIKAWQIIQSTGKFDDWHLDIVGDGNDKNSYMRLVDDSHINNISFYDWGNREEFMKSASIFLMTSRFEGFGMTIPEAQSFGCVPVAFNSFPAASELIDNGKNGLLVEKFGDVNKYAEALQTLMSDEIALAKMAANGIHAARRFYMKEIGPKWLTLLKELTGS